MLARSSSLNLPSCLRLILRGRTKILFVSSSSSEKRHSLSESPAGDISLLLLEFHGCNFEVRNVDLVEMFSSKELFELFFDPLLVFSTGSRVPAVEAIELKSVSKLTRVSS